MLNLRYIALSIALVSLPAPSFAQSQTYCQRLAAQLDMKPSAARFGNETPPAGRWKLNLLGGLGATLFGGSASASFSMRPTEETRPTAESAAAEYERLNNACQSTTKGIRCDVEGPAILAIGTKNGEVLSEAGPNERAVVEMRSGGIFCSEYAS